MPDSSVKKKQISINVSKETYNSMKALVDEGVFDSISDGFNTSAKTFFRLGNAVGFKQIARAVNGLEG